jgi:hypothetical protein
VQYRVAREALDNARVAREFYPVVVPVSSLAPKRQKGGRKGGGKESEKKRERNAKAEEKEKRKGKVKAKTKTKVIINQDIDRGAEERHQPEDPHRNQVVIHPPSVSSADRRVISLPIVQTTQSDSAQMTPTTSMNGMIPGGAMIMTVGMKQRTTMMISTRMPTSRT